MPAIAKVNAYANNEVGYLAWTLNGSIPGCLGFELTRIYVSDGDADSPAGTERVLAAWVPFKGQQNPDWKPQTTAVWPVQKLTWRDLTARQRRDRTELRSANVTVKYRVRALTRFRQGLVPVANVPERTYKGDPITLAYVDHGVESNEVTITSRFGDLQAAFNNGILSTQWLKHAFEAQGEGPLTKDKLMAKLRMAGNAFRSYLTGDALPMLRQLIDRAAAENGQVFMALYELDDSELVDLIVANAQRVHLILSNSSADRKTGEWDHGNVTQRARVRAANPAEMYDRMFNNRHIGHNKFVVYESAAGPQAVLTGSTNWTTNGLCAQSNNALIIQNASVARQYRAYWDALKQDSATFTEPNPAGDGTANVQGKNLRTDDAIQLAATTVSDVEVTPWRSPNTPQVTKGKRTPPDLAAVYSLMRKAKHAIFFAVFMPSVKGATSIVEEAINMGQSDPSLLVYGSVSDPKVMPNYVAPQRNGDDDSESTDEKPKQPATYDTQNVHVVRASALIQGDVVGDFEAELLSARQCHHPRQDCRNRPAVAGLCSGDRQPQSGLQGVLRERREPGDHAGQPKTGAGVHGSPP